MKDLDLKGEKELLEDLDLTENERMSIRFKMKKKKYDYLYRQLKRRKKHSLTQYLSWCRQKGVADSLDAITSWCRHKPAIESLQIEDEREDQFEQDEESDVAEVSDEEDSDVVYVKTIKTGVKYVKIEPKNGWEPYFKRAQDVNLDAVQRKRIDFDDEKQGEEP